MDVIIVSHTEYGCVRGEGRLRRVIPAKSSTKGVEEGAEKLAQIADSYGAKVTFAVMPEVAGSFPDLRHEIGLHVHPGWSERRDAGITFYVGDAYLREHCTQSNDSTVLRDHPFTEQLELINVGKEHIADRLGVDPTSFVAGCWSINNDTVKALVTAGLSHECSGVAHSKTAGYDWSRLPRICMPYHPRCDDYQAQGDVPLLIVPISQMLRTGNVNPEMVPLLGLSWLKACFLEYYSERVPLFHICVHSPAMTDPYFVSAMDGLLKFISKRDVTFKFASEVEPYEPVEPKTRVMPYMLHANRLVLRLFLRSRISWRSGGEL
jgi:hypothetical protein